MDDQTLPQSEQNVPETTPIKQSESVNSAPSIPTDPSETPQQIDWRKFKEARKIERQAKEAAEKQAQAKTQEAEALKAALEALVNKPNPQTTSQGDVEETEEQRIQRLVDQRIAQAENKRKQEQLELEIKESFPRAQRTYSDFNQIYTQENCDYLEFHHPELFNSLKNETDSFDKWTRVYNALKRYIPNAANSSKDQKRAEKNMSKPQAMAGAGRTVTGDGQPRTLDHAAKNANWERMVRTMKQVR